MSYLEEKLNKYGVKSANNQNTRSDYLQNKLNKYTNNIDTTKEDKSLLKTAGAGTYYLGQGAMKGLEGVFIDTPLTIAAGIQKLLGNEEEANALMEASNISATNALINAVSKNEINPYLNNNQNLLNEEVDKNSYIKENNLGGQIISSVGEMLPTIAVGGAVRGSNAAKQLAGNVMLGSKAFSGATNEAYQESGDIGKSMLYGGLNAGTEILTEKISGGIPGLKQIPGETGKEIAKNYLKNVAGESVEEIVASLANPLLQTTYKGADALSQYGTSDYWKGVGESGIVGAAVGGILDAPNAINTTIRQNSLNNHANSNETTTNLASALENQNNAQNDLKMQKMSNVDLYSYAPTNNIKINNLHQSAVQNGLNNFTETQQMLSVMEKVIKDKDYNVIFDSSIVNKNGESVNAQITSDENGVTIKINPNSERAGEFLLAHEITHAIGTEEMKTFVMNYAKKNTNVQQAIDELMKNYSVAEINDEVLSDISGQLFGNQEFINSLVMENTVESRTFIQKIYEAIRNFARGFTKEGRYKNFVDNLEKMWREAYSTQTNNMQPGTQYSMIGEKGALNVASANEQNQFLLNDLETAKSMAKEGKSNAEIFDKTGWFKQYGKWKFEISDSVSDGVTINKVEKNKEYLLSEILNHKDLFVAYKDFKDTKVSFMDLKDYKGKIVGGQYDTKTKTIELNNKLLDTKNPDKAIKRVLMHEIQHKIQQYEGFKKGSTGLFGETAYHNSKGEIEATETEKRLEMSYTQRRNEMPNAVNSRMDNIPELLYNGIGKEKNVYDSDTDSIVDIDGNFMDKTSDEILERSDAEGIYRGNRSEQQELDNSSFFNEENTENSSNEKQKPSYMWHGTTKENLDSIKNNGFREDRRGYFATNHEVVKSNYGEDVIMLEQNDFNLKDITNEVMDFGMPTDAMREQAKTEGYDGIKYQTSKNNEDVEVFNIKKLNEVFDKTELENFELSQALGYNLTSEEQQRYDKLKNKNIKNSPNETPKTDNQGRTLTKEQQEYFKDSKVRDENGNLKVLYHGTPNEFNKFSYEFLGTNGTVLGKGFYLTDDTKVAEAYANKGENGKVMKLYADIKKPLKWGETTISKQQFQKFVEAVNQATEGRLFADYSGEFSEKGSQQYNSTLNDILMDYEYGGDDIDLVSGILNSTGMSWDKGYGILKDTTGYDGIIVTTDVYDSGEGNVYIPFQSNQIKNVDNTNPTSDADIRYSQNNKEYEQWLDENFEAPGTRTDMSKMKGALPRVETKKVDSNKKKIREKVSKAIERQSYKAVNTATKVGQSYLDFDRTEKAKFKEQLSKYIGKTKKQLTNADTWNDIKSIVNEYSNKEFTYVDNELKGIKNQIRNANIKVTDDISNQITDFNDFRKANFGKLKLGKTGTSIDSFYQELSEQYPYYFGKATTEADMLYELSDFMNQDINITQKFKIDEATLDKATTKIYNSLLQNSMSIDEVNTLRTQLEEKMNARTRSVIQEELLDEMGITLEDIAQGKDISSIDIARTDPIRLNEKIFGAKTGKKINEATVNKTKHNEAERIRFLNRERNEIKNLGIKPGSKESAAVQKYGEKQYITKNNEVKPYGDNELANEFSDIATQEKIKKAAQVIRGKYDRYIDQINYVLTDLGYDPIKKRNDYMRHFQALNDVFSKFGIPLNKESLQNDSLPTSINGLTDQFKPGKNYFANALQRIGMKTEYDAITGIDGYLDGASNLIYHTEDIQRYRTLSKLVRNTYGTIHGFDDLASMNEEQQTQRIQDIQSNKLAKYAAWLDEQANVLAGKKGKIDRGAEELLGRKIYTILDTAKKQVGSNMTGFNVRSALTNFASAVQGASKTNKLAFIKGTVSTINNIVKDDGLIYKSDFLSSRFGSDQLSKKIWQKASSAGQIFMQGTDYFTANQIWRSKYYENLSKGMNEANAIKSADDFSSRIMGDRSKGSTATLFNSKTLGLLTQFQLEVNNQWSSLIHDNKMDIQNGEKTASSLLFQTGQLFALSYMFNSLMKSLTGSDVMIDPFDLLKRILGEDEEDKEKSIEERATEVLGEVVNDLPFVSVFTGGRIPVSEAFKGVTTGFKYATGTTDNYGNKYKLSDVGNDLIESAFYWILPTGYGQASKTAKGISMYSGKLPTAGSYTDSGNLRFTADESAGGKTKAALFGQYASAYAQDYIDSGFRTISKNQIQEMKDLGMNSTEYRKYRAGLNEAGTKNAEKIDYINGLDVSIEQKNIMANNVIDSKNYNVDMKDYDKYGSYEAMSYAMKNPEKYSAIAIVTDYDTYAKYKEDVEKIKETYKGTENTSIRKRKIYEYLNKQDLSKAQKEILYGLLGGYSLKAYKNSVFNYINNQKDLTKSEKEAIWKYLYD